MEPELRETMTPPDKLEAAKALVKAQTEIAFSARPIEEIARAQFNNMVALAEIAPDLITLAEAQASRIETLEAASKALQKDMLQRAEMNKHQHGGDLVVEAGCGVWANFCNALERTNP